MVLFYIDFLKDELHSVTFCTTILLFFLKEKIEEEKEKGQNKSCHFVVHLFIRHFESHANSVKQELLIFYLLCHLILYEISMISSNM